MTNDRLMELLEDEYKISIQLRRKVIELIDENFELQHQLNKSRATSSLMTQQYIKKSKPTVINTTRNFFIFQKKRNSICTYV